MRDAVGWGKKLRQARERSGRTQAELADEVFVQRNSISRWETGERTPSPADREALARVLIVPVEELFPPAPRNTGRSVDLLIAARRAIRAKDVDELRDALIALDAVVSVIDAEASAVRA